MSNTLSVRVTNRKTETGAFYEGTVSIAGLKPTKLSRKSDGSTQFPTKSALSGAARNLAKSLGFANVDITDTSANIAAKKSAAKQTTAAKKPAPVAKTCSQTCEATKTN